MFDPWVGKIPQRREYQPTPVFLPGEFHGQRSLEGYGPWGYEELDMTEWLHFTSLQSWFQLVLLPAQHFSWCTQQIWKTQQWSQDWKRSVFIPIPKKGNAKEGSNYHTIALISHASKVMLKSLQARLQQYVNREHPHVQAGFRKGRGTRDQIANTHWIIKKAREFQRNI